MAVAVQQIHSVVHLPLVLGVLRRLAVAPVVDCLIPPHPAQVLSCGRGVEALVLAILDGDPALYKVGRRLEERGMVALLQAGLHTRLAQCLSLRAPSRCAVCGQSHPGLWRRRSQSAGGLCHPDTLVASGYHDDDALWRV